MHDTYNQLFDGILDAIQFGFNMNRLSAGLVRTCRSMAVTATGGRLEGLALDPLIAHAPSVAAWTGWNAAARDVVAKGMQQQWSTLAQSVWVPGLPWYPSFAAFPGPVAPPTPNVPTPFIALVHNTTAISALSLQNAMRWALRDTMDYSAEFFDSVGHVAADSLQTWTACQSRQPGAGHRSGSDLRPTVRYCGPGCDKARSSGDRISIPERQVCSSQFAVCSRRSGRTR